MRVSIIIPILDDYPRLQKCLSCLEEQTYDGAFEVIIADNGTPRAKIPELRSSRFEIVQIREEKPGSYSARNAALKHARGDLFAFTDSDCLPRPEWLERGVNALEDRGELALVGGAVDVFAKHEGQPTLAEQWELVRAFPQHHYLQDLHFAATANAFTSRRVLDDVGPFSDSLKSGGDRELGERIFNAGYPLVWEPAALVLHPARRSMDELLTKVVRVTRGDYRREQLVAPWPTGRKAKTLVKLTAQLGTKLPQTLGNAASTRGTARDRVRFAVADALVSTTRKLTMIREISIDLWLTQNQNG